MRYPPFFKRICYALSYPCRYFVIRSARTFYEAVCYNADRTPTNAKNIDSDKEFYGFVIQFFNN